VAALDPGGALLTGPDRASVRETGLALVLPE
jgi:hypothetical protein